MKKLLLTLAALLALALLFAAGGILLSPRSLRLGADKVLTWRLDQPVLDYASAVSLPWLGGDTHQSLAAIYPALRQARRDPSVKGLALYIQSADFGLATAQELRGLLARLRASGKFVDCYLESAGDGGNGTLAYYVASACGSISLTPSAELNLIGLYADSTFVRGALEKLRIDPNFSHVGRYKSASETYTEYGHSPAAREAISALLDDFFDQIVAGVAGGRELPVERVRELIDQAPYTAPEALDLGLVDALAYPDEFAGRVDARLGADVLHLSLDEYRSSVLAGSGRRVAVVFAQGTIVRGAGGVDPWTDEAFVGSDDLGESLSALAKDDSVAAVVLRIDSPGGSALASDLILRQAELLARAKPLVVSMSNLAASGGYYIAAGAKKILASPASLTGSIGVVGGKLVTRRFQQELLGISHDGLKRGANADIYSSIDSFSPAQSEHFQRMMQRVYDLFVGHVAEGRAMPRERVEEVAAGRVWSGSRALELGLVDELGGLEEAVDAARAAAGVATEEPLRLELLPRPPGLLDLLLRPSRGLCLAELVARGLGAPSNALRLLELPPDLADLAHLF